MRACPLTLSTTGTFPFNSNGSYSSAGIHHPGTTSNFSFLIRYPGRSSIFLPHSTRSGVSRHSAAPPRNTTRSSTCLRMAEASACHSSAVRTRGISGTRVSLNTCTSSSARSGPMISSANAVVTSSAVNGSTLATRFSSANAALKNDVRLPGVRHISHSSSPALSTGSTSDVALAASPQPIPP